MRTIPWRVLLAAAALGGAPAGCGGGSDYQNKPRPPSPINVTAAITDKRVTLSPRSFGAGPVVFIVSNQTSSPQTLTFETEELGGSKPGLRKRTDAIQPRGTATLKVDVTSGTYAARVRSHGIAPATVKVGRERRSAQDQLLEP